MRIRTGTSPRYVCAPWPAAAGDSSTARPSLLLRASRGWASRPPPASCSARFHLAPALETGGKQPTTPSLREEILAPASPDRRGSLEAWNSTARPTHYGFLP